MLAYFIDHPHVDNPDVSHWTSVQNLAYEDTPKATAQLKRYILEAQRIRVDLPLIRVYSPAKANDTFKLRLGNDKKDTCTLVKGDKVLLQLVGTHGAVFGSFIQPLPLRNRPSCQPE